MTENGLELAMCLCTTVPEIKQQCAQYTAHCPINLQTPKCHGACINKWLLYNKTQALTQKFIQAIPEPWF